jgi:hypothetical protein
MQKLNGREIYVLIILILTTGILLYLTLNDILNDVSSVSKTAEGVVSIRAMDLRTHVKATLQVILNMGAIILFWRIKKLGWILAMPILLFYAFLIGYLMTNFGFVDVQTTAIGVSGLVIFLLGVIFLIIPSTMRKYNLKKTSTIPVFIVIALLVFLYFGII